MKKREIDVDDLFYELYELFFKYLIIRQIQCPSLLQIKLMSGTLNPPEAGSNLFVNKPNKMKQKKVFSFFFFILEMNSMI